jgi:hypothetical protein
MSIGHIENYPTQPPEDMVETVDPKHDETLELSPGVDTDETEYFRRARRHIDPLGKALSGLGVGRSRELDQHPGYEGLLTDPRTAQDPDAPFRNSDLASMSSGTTQRSDRWVHDQALQVRQLLATGFLVSRFTFPASPLGLVPQLILPRRPERMSLTISTIVANPVYIGPSGSVSPSSGFPIYGADGNGNLLPPVPFVVTGEIWGCGDGINPIVAFVLETLRSDNPAS